MKDITKHPKKRPIEYPKITLYSSSIMAMQQLWDFYIGKNTLDFQKLCERITFVGGYDTIGSNIKVNELYMLVTTGYPSDLKTLASFISELLACYTTNNNYIPCDYDVFAFLFCSSTAYRLFNLPKFGWWEATPSYIIKGLNQICKIFSQQEKYCLEECLLECVFSHD
jgi:hypothetical protein